jgi:hypothetical protein
MDILHENPLSVNPPSFRPVPGRSRIVALEGGVRTGYHIVGHEHDGIFHACFLYPPTATLCWTAVRGLAGRDPDSYRLVAVGAANIDEVLEVIRDHQFGVADLVAAKLISFWLQAHPRQPAETLTREPYHE